MNYQVLARKWRPHDFNQVVGQQHVRQALTNALDQQRLHHAYLFSGTRGVGKTTIARIFAKCLNCEAGVSASPCHRCTSCEEIDQGRQIDLIEVDAASRTKVEDTRELLNNVLYPPVNARHKVYLIDEVHMLSGHSFNALLKTLEEPPAHVIFLLATTDPQKLPVTILSRCLQFHLKHMPEEQISEHLQQVLSAEKITFEPSALRVIASAAAGSMRDALSILDQTIAYCNNDITLTATQQLLGTIDNDCVVDLLEHIIAANSDQLLTISERLATLGVDFAKTLEALLSCLHQVTIAQVTNQQVTEQKLVTLAKQISPETIQLYYQIGLTGRRDLPLSPTPRIGFEMTLLRMVAFTLETPATIPANHTTSQHNIKHSTSDVSRPDKMKMHAVQSAMPAATTQPATVPPQPADPTPHTTLPATVPPQPTDPTPHTTPPAVANSCDWTQLLPQLPLTGITKMIAAHCALGVFSDEKIELLLEPSQAAILTPHYQQAIQQALDDHFQQPRQLTITVSQEPVMSPTRIKKQNDLIKQQAAEKSLKENPTVQQLITQYDANIVTNSIASVTEEN